MAESSLPAVAVVPIPCPHCAYDLRGKPGTRNCPECGVFVFDALFCIRNNAAQDIDMLRTSAKWSVTGWGIMLFGLLVAFFLAGEIAIPFCGFAAIVIGVGAIKFLAALCYIVFGGFKENRREQLVAFGLFRWLMINLFLEALPFLFYLSLPELIE